MRKGFTLTEILIVMAVIAILAALIVRISVTTGINNAGTTRAKATIDQIAAGAVLYYQDTGTWAPDVLSSGGNASFYNKKYLNVVDSPTWYKDEPVSYLGKKYFWDWQNWTFPNSPGFQCWQSEDLYSGTPGNGTLVMRKCVRDVCINQKYCNNNGFCFNSASDRDNNKNTIGTYSTAGVSAICEECFDKVSCSKKFVQ
jgi:prepilin-type N-terminal cleavage/methylation domain-containing protein